MKKLAYLLLVALLAACGNDDDFPETKKVDPDPVIPPPTGITDGGEALFGSYEGVAKALVGTYGTEDLTTFDITADMTPLEETETIVKAPEAGYEDFVENYGYDEMTGETDNAVKTLQFAYVNGLVQGQYYTKKGNLKATFTSSRTIVDDDDPSVTEAYVEIKGQHVTVKALKKFNFVLTGTGKEGSSFKLYSDKKFQLTLDNVSLHNNQGAAVNLQKSFNVDEENKYKGKRAYIIVKGENTLKDSKVEGYVKTNHPNSGEEEDEKGVVFSEGKLLVSGSGTLNIEAQGKHGIVSDDYVYMHAGVTVNITSALGYDAVKTNDGIVIAGGVHNYTVAGEGSKGLNSDSTITVKGGRMTIIDAAVQEPAIAATITGINASRVIVDGGSLLVKTGGTAIDARDVFAMTGGTVRVIAKNDGATEAMAKAKAIEAAEVYVNDGLLTLRATKAVDAKNRITMSGGLIEAYTTGKALHAARNIQVKGGGIYAVSTSDDAIVSDGIIGISGGILYANAANSTQEGIDCKNNLFKVDGGVMIAIGGKNSSPTKTDSKQHSIVSFVEADGSVNGIMTGNGTCLASFKAENSDGVTKKELLFSAPTLTETGDYSITMGGTAELKEGGTAFHNVYVNAVKLTGVTVIKSE